MVLENEIGDEIERAAHNTAWKGEHLGGNNGGNGVRRIMKPIDEVEDQGQGDDDD